MIVWEPQLKKEPWKVESSIWGSMDGTKENMTKLIRILFILLVCISTISCNQIVETVYYSQINQNDTIGFKDYKYVIDSNNRRAYVTSENEIMDGHFVVKRYGNLYEEFDLTEGYLDGYFIRYHENGSVELHETYTNSYLNGTSYEGYENGNVKKEMTFINGEKTTDEIEYDRNGNLSIKRFKENDILYQIHYSNNKRIGSVFEKALNGIDYEIIIKYDLFENVEIIIGRKVEIKEPILYVFDANYEIIEEINAAENPQRAMQLFQKMPQL